MVFVLFISLLIATRGRGSADGRGRRWRTGEAEFGEQFAKWADRWSTAAKEGSAAMHTHWPVAER